MPSNHINIMATLGPASRDRETVRGLKDRGVNFMRLNMSHSLPEDLPYFIELANEAGVPFVLDTEGSQIRTGYMENGAVDLVHGGYIKIHKNPVKGNMREISLRPSAIVDLLEEEDIIRPDFYGVQAQVVDLSPREEGYIIAHVLYGGRVGSNKGVVVQRTSQKAGHFSLPALSERDLAAIQIGLKERVGAIAASFMRSADFVREVRQATEGSMKIISKIECVDGLKNLDEIIAESDYLLVDRGDLSKEVPIERLPFLQKMIISRARNAGKEVFVATNLLESMLASRNPTRAEVHDVVNSVLDGASGLVLAAETAIGEYPLECASTLRSLAAHASLMIERGVKLPHSKDLIEILEKEGYILETLGL